MPDAGGAAPGRGVAAACALLALALMAARRRRGAGAARNPPLGPFIEVDGVRLHWVARGEGPPPVVLHGNGSLAQDVLLGDFAARAGRRHRVLIFDRPGHGRSTRPRGRSFPPGEQARLLAQALDALGVRRPLLLGHSRGARVAVAWALQRPREVRGLLLEGGTFHPTPRLDVRLAAGLAVPVALVCGGDRMVDPRTQSVACHRRLPDATLTLVPDCGHVVHHTAPAALLDALDALDRRCAPHPLPGAPDLWAGRRVLPRPRRPGPGARPPLDPRVRSWRPRPRPCRMRSTRR
ncbi:hypothetical protein M446_0741 [Methylobacterium sp. 4-46]|uniref:alpha/beta fold hydrolase n=1 Tax=unclassified Methylobacterium TaxID=2615210 RepID=UPI000165C773|nr:MULTISPECIES: alpha/beta hydrolase [Methylobacterium]ACA15299.1 hypothetical protein M446_0741 [Methylobacterium sp. 4-46]WFT81025.1 alpha/beta hydrolase [Methylobacterium nodulans]